MSDLLNTQFKCILCPYEHFEDTILKCLRTKNCTISNNNNINPPATCYPTLYKNACELCTHVTKKQNIHLHHFTCYEGPKEFHGWRIDSLQGCIAKMHPVQLIPSPTQKKR